MDINNRQDIELLVNSFYDRVKQDDTIGFIFQQIIGADWSHHLPIMYNFWDTILFHTATYQGQPIAQHIKVDRQIKLEQAHYERWLQLWDETINSLFAGAVAEEAKKRAKLMMDLISMKVEWARTGKAIV